MSQQVKVIERFLRRLEFHASKVPTFSVLDIQIIFLYQEKMQVYGLYSMQLE